MSNYTYRLIPPTARVSETGGWWVRTLNNGKHVNYRVFNTKAEAERYIEDRSASTTKTVRLRFDRVEILNRLKAVEAGEMTLYERELVEQLEAERRWKDEAQEDALYMKEQHETVLSNYQRNEATYLEMREVFDRKVADLEEQLETARVTLEDQAGEFGNERYCWQTELDKENRAVLRLQEQLEAAHQFILHVADGTLGSWEAAASEARAFLGEPDGQPASSPEERAADARSEFIQENEWTPGNAHRDSDPAKEPTSTVRRPLDMREEPASWYQHDPIPATKPEGGG